MKATYSPGKFVDWYMGSCVVDSIEEGQEIYYRLKHRNFDLYCRVSESRLTSYNSQKKPLNFIKRPPSLLVSDDFYSDPLTIRKIALEQSYTANIKSYKGKRSECRFLLPGLKEEFERLLGVKITGWTTYLANGVFQITKYTDPLVWHADLQSYAAAIYLTPDAPVTAGTSFWRDTKYKCRRTPGHQRERNRFPTDEDRKIANDTIHSDYNLVHPDNWELVDRVGSIFNRLVIWDAKLIHSASSYEAFPGTEGQEAENSRLVQLFFFDIE